MAKAYRSLLEVIMSSIPDCRKMSRYLTCLLGNSMQKKKFLGLMIANPNLSSVRQFVEPNIRVLNLSKWKTKHSCLPYVYRGSCRAAEWALRIINLQIWGGSGMFVHSNVFRLMHGLHFPDDLVLGCFKVNRVRTFCFQFVLRLVKSRIVFFG